MTNIKPVSREEIMTKFFHGHDLTRREKKRVSYLLCYFYGLKAYEEGIKEQAFELGKSVPTDMQESVIKKIAETEETISGDYQIDVLCTAEEAIRCIKSNWHKGISYCIRTNAHLITQENEDGTYRFYERSHHINVSQKQAIDYISTVMKGMEDRGAKISVNKYHNIFFIG